MDIGAGKKISTLRDHFRAGKRLGSRGEPRCPRGCPQLGPVFYLSHFWITDVLHQVF